MKHVMLDLETMGGSSGAAIVSIGAVRFEPTDPKSLERFEGNQFYAVVDLQSCLDAGLRVDATTLYWWLSQSHEARAALLVENKVHLHGALTQFSRWFDGSKYLWSHGANFDVPVLEGCYNAMGFGVPWDFRQVRDTRTLFSLVGEKIKKGAEAHHALSDAINQATAVVKATQKLMSFDITPGLGMVDL